MGRGEDSVRDSDVYRDGFYEFFARARLQNILGQAGASVTTVAFGWSHANHARLITYLVIHQTLVAVMAVAFTSRWTNSRTDSDGIPRYAAPALMLTQAFCGSVMWLDLTASRSIVFALSSLIVMYACAAGTMVTLGPIRTLARLALLSLLLPGALASLWVGHLVLGFGTLFFLFVVAALGVTEMDQSYRELITLRAQSMQSASAMRVRAHHDSLTGLLNRAGLAEAFEELEAEPRAALYIDLDHFKEVNDKAGHQVGDELLQRVAQRLSNRLQPGAQVARLGGDEFFALIAATEDIVLADLAGELIKIIEAPYKLREGTYSVSASVGAARLEPTVPLDVAIHRSDRAMLGAKASGRGVALLYSEAFESMIKSIDIEQELRACIDRGEFEVHGQPVFNLETGVVEAIELLARPAFADRLGIGPALFIPVAERVGLIDELSALVLRSAAEAAIWIRSEPALRGAVILVNISPVSLIGEHLVDTLQSLFVEFGLGPGQLAIEITESLSMNDVQRSVATLERLQLMGVDIALDDFGSGYSSVEQLLTLPISLVKIDQTVLHHVADAKGSTNMLKAIVDLASSAGQRTVAEGIESAAHLEVARNAGVNLGQGHYLARPTPLEVIAPTLGAALAKTSP